jgi:segregation and condensation protein B
MAYALPVSHADVAHIRGTDSAGVIDTLLARKQIAHDARFQRAGSTVFVVTSDRFPQVLRLGSLAELPPREAVKSVAGMTQCIPLNLSKRSPGKCTVETRNNLRCEQLAAAAPAS